MNFPRTLGGLRQSPFSEEKLRTRRVKDELRENLIARLRDYECVENAGLKETFQRNHLPQVALPTG